ncbi:MAG: lipid-A-disaccharide synthase [Holosporales bacterium]|jgi:lipid-A-disaccharide synthase|nr:lipid-A-disaccharide synthase [Holosporales bacterium]
MTTTICKSVFIAAGEPSGDQLGASLIQDLTKRAAYSYNFLGIGGEAMCAAGLASLFPMENIAIMGFLPVISHLPQLIRCVQQAKRALLAHPPDLLITIDAPGFMNRLHKTARSLGVPILHWVAPSVWAWRPKRARKLALRIDHLLTLFPFEPPFFTPYGLKATYVGHPIAKKPMFTFSKRESEEFCIRHGITSTQFALCILPGSRKLELERHLPIFEETVRLLLKERPNLHVILPTLLCWREYLAEKTQHWPCTPTIISSAQEKRLAFHVCSAALAVSGTVTLELAYAKTPTVVAYKTDWFSAALIRRVLCTPFVALPNIILQKPIMPEFLQEKCTPPLLVEALRAFYSSGKRAKVKHDLQQVIDKMHTPTLSAAEVAEQHLAFSKAVT